MAVTGKGDYPNIGNIVLDDAINNVSKTIPGKVLSGRAIWSTSSEVRTISRDYFFDATPPSSGGTQIYRTLLGVG